MVERTNEGMLHENREAGSWRTRAAPKMLVAALLAVSSCGGAEGSGQSSVEQQVAGGDTRDVTNSLVSPYDAVGWLSTPVGNCSGTLIKRDVFLTARHCVCFAPTPANLANTTVRFGTSGSPGQTFQAKGIAWHGTQKQCPAGNSYPTESSSRDLAVVFLTKNVPPSVAPVYGVPQLPDVYTAGDMVERAFITDWPTFFQSPIEMIGWGGTSSNSDNGVARNAGTPAGVAFTLGCAFAGYFCNDSYWIAYSPLSLAQTWPTDSGGPIVFNRDGQTPTVFGVHSQHFTFSPTWDNGESNGAFIRQFMDDADGDGVNDAVDNCDPNRVGACSTNPNLCFNPDQNDGDQDGVGDACDNCPASLCLARGQSAATCYNPKQLNFDSDSYGDVCDSCPRRGNEGLSAQLADDDGDGVGNACDNCNRFNRVRACKTGADCGDVIGCITETKPYGRCLGGSTSCLSDADCDGKSCVEIGSWGRCALQTDNDHDGIGAPCDLCDNAANPPVQANSNDRAETRENVAQLGDFCDPVPTFVSRAVVSTLNTSFDATQATMFRSSAQVGSTTNQPHAPVPGQVGFRWCGCHSFLPGQDFDVPPDDCWDAPIFCSKDPGQFGLAEGSPGNRWHRVTVGSNGAAKPDDFTFPPASTTLDPTLSRTFTGTATFKDTLPYASINETQRLGTVENLFWMQATDVAAGRVAAFDSATRTTGFFWSHVAYDTAHPGSVRDVVSAGALRDQYEYVRTPLVGVAFPGGVHAVAPCPQPNCQYWFRPDWLVDPDPMETVSSPFQAVVAPARLAVLPDATVVAENDAVRVDVTSALSPVLRQAAGFPGIAWVSPVEAGFRGVVRDSSTVQAAIVPSDWTQTFQRPIGVIARRSGLSTTIEFREIVGRAATQSLQTSAPAMVPSDRTKPRYVFSGRDQSLYMVGGVGTLGASHEIWRYSFVDDAWTRVQLPFQTPIGGDIADDDLRNRPVPGTVLAVAYDGNSDRMVVVNEDLRNAKAQAKVVRFVVYDFVRRNATISLELPRIPIFDSLHLVARETGTFVLVGARDDRWTAWEFRLREDGTLQWLGLSSGRGTVLDDPINSRDGILLPVAMGGRQQVLSLEPDAFKYLPVPCSGL